MRQNFVGLNSTSKFLLPGDALRNCRGQNPP